MNSVFDWVTPFKSIAERLNALSFDPGAICFYEIMSGGLIWTDEKPPFETTTEELGSLRMLWNYRTSLLLGKPRSEFDGLWNSAIGMAPRWPYFLPERRIATPELLSKVQQGEAETQRICDWLDSLED